MSSFLPPLSLARALVIATVTLTPLPWTGGAWAQSPEDLLATYQAQCSREAHREAARKGPQQALDHGALCDGLAKRIQQGLETQGSGAKTSPLARPDPTIWPDSGTATPTPPAAWAPPK